MRRIFLLTICSAVAACTTPSTMMVNRDGKVLRCAAHGWGNAIAIGTAEQIHDTCVRDARMVGFLPLPKVSLGFVAETKVPMRVIEVDGANAQTAGIKVGDIILELDSRKIESFYTVVQVLNNKKVGDRVPLNIQRNQEILPITVTVGPGRF